MRGAKGTTKGLQNRNRSDTQLQTKSSHIKQTDCMGSDDDTVVSQLVKFTDGNNHVFFLFIQISSIVPMLTN